MKKLILIIMVLLVSHACKAQSSAAVQDTLKYLQDSVEAKKSIYIGQPLSKLLADLKIGVVAHLHDLMLPSYEPDPVSTDGIILYFDEREFNLTPPQMMARSTRTGSPPVNYHIPSLIITFAPLVSVPKSLLDTGGVLNGYTWTSGKQSFWGSKIVADIKVSED